MRVVVTGGAGFIGANLCRRLQKAGHVTTVVDNLSTGFKSNLHGLDAELCEVDIRDTAAMQKIIGAADTVVHLAARASVPRSIQDPALTNDVNVNGTMSVLLAARDSGAHVIFASSSSVYGANRELPKRESMRPQPMSPYAVSKLAGETYVLSFQHVYELPTLAFRFFNVYGPLQSAGHVYAAVVPAFGSALLAGDPITVFGDGHQSRDFTSVATVTSVLADAVTRRVKHNEPVNLAFGTRTTLLELIPMMEQFTGLSATVRHAEPRAGDVRDSQAANATLRQLFPGVEPQKLAEGLSDTLRWLGRNGTPQA